MFEKTLQEKLQRIFEVEAVRFEQPSEAHEQDCLFVHVDRARPVIKKGMQHFRVEGRALMFVNSDKMPFGYFAKCIAAHPAEAKDLFFYELEENSPLYQNIVQRGFSFVYFFTSQYDPPTATINSIQTEVIS